MIPVDYGAPLRQQEMVSFAAPDLALQLSRPVWLWLCWGLTMAGGESNPRCRRRKRRNNQRLEQGKCYRLELTAVDCSATTTTPWLACRMAGRLIS